MAAKSSDDAQPAPPDDVENLDALNKRIADEAAKATEAPKD